jgi:hypothetical protein
VGERKRGESDGFDFDFGLLGLCIKYIGVFLFFFFFVPVSFFTLVFSFVGCFFVVVGWVGDP